MQTASVKEKTQGAASARQRSGKPIASVPCPYCGGRAWFSSPVPDEAPCSCQACGGTGRVFADEEPQA
jgi:DnaJ-class molecular chaperone